MRTISNEGLQLIKSFEGCRLTAYDDLQPRINLTDDTEIIGTLTIGWGYTSNVYIGQTISQEEADALLLETIKRYVGYVNSYYFVPITEQLNQNQFDALVSFCYNCGQGNLKLLCQNRTVEEIAISLRDFTKSKGTVLLGLVRRREAEKLLFEKAVEEMENPNNAELLLKINELEEIVKKTIMALTQISDRLADIPAPDWFVNEFPSALELLNQKSGTIDFWRAFAITLRIVQK